MQIQLLLRPTGFFLSLGQPPSSNTVTDEGLKAIRLLASEHVNIPPLPSTPPCRAFRHAQRARYLAVYYNRMLNIDIDAAKVIKR